MSERISELQTQIDRLGPRGRELWTSLHVEFNADAATEPLMLELCRLVDRLDRLDRAIKSQRPWFTIAETAAVSPDTLKVTVAIDSVLVEARQQALALNTILQKLGVGKLDAAPKEDSADDLLGKIRGLRQPASENRATE